MLDAQDSSPSHNVMSTQETAEVSSDVVAGDVQDPQQQAGVSENQGTEEHSRAASLATGESSFAHQSEAVDSAAEAAADSKRSDNNSVQAAETAAAGDDTETASASSSSGLTTTTPKEGAPPERGYSGSATSREA